MLRSMELVPVQNSFGYAEAMWSLRNLVRKYQSRNWKSVFATVQGYELLLAANNGWLVVFYSYEVEGGYHSGEFRIWSLFSSMRWQEQIAKYTERYPIGAELIVRVDPNNADSSVVR